MPEENQLIYDWNAVAEDAWRKPSHKIEFDDESLRDGFQSPSVGPPTVDERVRILHLLDNPTLAREMGARGCQKVHQRYTVEQMVQQTEALFERLLNHHEVS